MIKFIKLFWRVYKNEDLVINGIKILECLFLVAEKKQPFVSEMCIVDLTTNGKTTIIKIWAAPVVEGVADNPIDRIEQLAKENIKLKEEIEKAKNE